jgi:lipopolysaccharide transport system ATP-binding protein
MTDAITVTGLGKRFPRQRGRGRGTLKEAVLSGFRGGRTEYFWGLRGVTFTVPRARTIGIIGPNGAGKSTLLRLVGGIGRPDEGSVRTEGRISALLELNAGLSDELTGAENVFAAGVIGGMDRAEVRRRYDEIVAFAELEDFIDSPLRTYSSGMRMRLGFAVAVHIDPDILLIDEVLAVGDIAFQRKCLERIAAIKQRGCTILIVSHDLPALESLCDEILFLRSGGIAAYGPTREVLAAYEAAMAPDGYNSATAAGVADVPLPGGQWLRYGTNRFGTLEAVIEAVRLMTAEGAVTDTIGSGDPLVVEIDYRTAAPLKGVKGQVKISLQDGSPCLDATTETAAIELPASGRATLRVLVERLDLAAGEYHVGVALHEPDWQYSYDNHLNVYPLRIAGSAEGGLLAPPIRWAFLPGATAPAAQVAGKPPEEPSIGRQEGA